MYELLWIIQRKKLGRYLKSDLIDFLSVILVASIIKLNAQPSQWFSEYPIIGHDVIKRIMSGSKLLRVLRYLHVCEMNKQVSSENPQYIFIFKGKVSEKTEASL